MKVAIINFTAGGMSGGYRKYLLNIIPRMADHPEVKALLCLSPAKLQISSWFNQLPNVEFISCRPYSIFRRDLDSEARASLERFSPDIIFMPIERYISSGKTPVVNMVRNMEPFEGGTKDFSIEEKMRHFLQYHIARRAIVNADRVLAVSKFVCDFLVRKWNIPEGKIGLVYHGLETDEGSNTRPKMIPQDWDGRFLFTAGSIRPARGLEDAISAIRHLSVSDTVIKGLVIAGGCSLDMIWYQRKLKRLIQSYNLSSMILWTGNLGREEMNWCYNNCNIFLMTSRVESFGMIAVEAMAHGCICISTNNPCLPEIFGDTASYYLPGDVELLSESIQKLCCLTEEEKHEISRRARKRAAKFNWDKCVELTINEFKKAVTELAKAIASLNN